MGLSEESWSLQGFYTVSLLLADVQLDKVLLFFSVKKSEFYWEFGVKVMEIKVGNLRYT